MSTQSAYFSSASDKRYCSNSPMSRETRACNQVYLFDSLNSKAPSSARKVHIRRLADVLQLSIHQRDWPRAKRAWSILIRCPEFEWKNMWRTGLLLLQCTDSAAEPSEKKCLEYLRVMMLQCPENVSHPGILGPCSNQSYSE